MKRPRRSKHRPSILATHRAVAETRTRDLAVYDRDGRRRFVGGRKQRQVSRLESWARDKRWSQLAALALAGQPLERCICGVWFRDYRVHRTTRQHKHHEAVWRATQRRQRWRTLGRCVLCGRRRTVGEWCAKHARTVGAAP